VTNNPQCLTHAEPPIRLISKFSYVTQRFERVELPGTPRDCMFRGICALNIVSCIHVRCICYDGKRIIGRGSVVSGGRLGLDMLSIFVEGSGRFKPQCPQGLGMGMRRIPARFVGLPIVSLLVRMPLFMFLPWFHYIDAIEPLSDLRRGDCISLFLHIC
jgi:hypothetical protein